MSDDVDAARFPTVALYVARHGGSLDVLPACQIKSAAVRDILQAWRLDDVEDGALPPQVLALARSPPPVSAWVPEVHSEALMCAISDRYLPTQEIADRYVFESTTALFNSPLYKLLMVVISPSLLMRASADRWAQFHKGSSLVLEDRTPRSVRARLSFPRDLFIPENRLSLLPAFRAALAVAGAKSPIVAMERFSPTEMLFTGQWS